MIKNKKIEIRCTEEFKNKLKARAKELNISMGELLIFCYTEGTSYKKVADVLGLECKND